MKAQKILGYLMVKDDWPLVEYAITHCIENVVDHLVVVSHSSSADNNRNLQQLITKWTNKITYHELQSEEYLQGATTLYFLSLSSPENYDWIYIFDSDEFLMSRNNISLKSYLADLDQGVSFVRYPVEHWVSNFDTDLSKSDWFETVVHKAIPSNFIHKTAQILADEIINENINFFDLYFASKIIFRSQYFQFATAGSHYLAKDITAQAPTVEHVASEIYAGHLPMEAYSRLKARSEQGRLLVESGFEFSHGWQNQMLYKVAQMDGLERFWALHSVSNVANSNLAYHYDESLRNVLRTASNINCISPTLDLNEITSVNEEVALIPNSQIYDKSINVIHNKLRQIEKALEERDSLIVERDSLIVERDSLIVERDSLIVERDSLIVERSLILESFSWKVTKTFRRTHKAVRANIYMVKLPGRQ